MHTERERDKRGAGGWEEGKGKRVRGYGVEFVTMHLSSVNYKTNASLLQKTPPLFRPPDGLAHKGLLL
jgi:hypothetical protein